ncbi:Di-trans-poly-cis-decaprenylcistransferase (undecaprenyl diphosphate synthetase) [Lacticaseibacillus sharpeae JCM 1186 = DSM 20505]|uniref:Isoprenyl transferase n=2 Tax=Lacticaseibacillus sharpeae TaxID=1626 RepID=A0A0R1ZL33_9LACO|nr:isoprenyl transferase [Lacticaseibacillus sharpeae]KRM55697.1 Di-trans-poly-cis-decaprenylcistransferase (undecaprenyl diphosphate synthetase) [Lacticaseibacillus sharpeae JCM 1186 = DSM 20505]
MDGNGRWAKKRFLPRIAGHKQGMDTVRTVTRAASDMGIKVLTLYAFSTENWGRPQQEVSYLMSLPVTFFNKFVPELIEQNVRVMVMGDITKLPDSTRQATEKAIADTAQNTGMVLNFALNYGGRDEIVRGVRDIARQVAAGDLDPDTIDDATVAQSLMTAPLGDLADPDLLIRTSGEERISNFLLWQIAYSEMVFTDKLWPDFDGDALLDAVKQYAARDRRFGKVK